MKRIVLVVMLVSILAVAFIAPTHTTLITAYSATAEATEASTETAGYQGPLDKELNVYNWADYIDADLLTEYQSKYNVKINYDNFASDEELLAKIQAGATGYDVIFPDDYMVARMIELNLLGKIDKANIPNIENIDPYNLNAWYDPGNLYCIPWQWGTTGIAYLASLEKPPTSWAALFDPVQAKYYSEHGGINLLDNQRDVIAAALVYLGYEVNDSDPAHLNQARDTVLKILPFIHSFNATDYPTTLLVPKEVAVSQAWNGDVAKSALETVSDKNPKGEWRYFVPKEGGVRYQDNVCITATTKHKATAEHFINFIIDGQAAARTSNFTGYVSANKAAEPFTKPEVLAFSPQLDALEKLQWIKPLDDATTKLYDQIWTEIRATP
ncbi:MAG: spermidine/putrescine ABC transporter substrate-binding protein [Chloroflexota bacterium]